MKSTFRILAVDGGSAGDLASAVLGARAVRVRVPLDKDHAMDDPAAVDRLNGAAVQFGENGLTTVKQPAGSTEKPCD